MPRVRVIANIATKSPASVSITAPAGDSKFLHAPSQLDLGVARIIPMQFFDRTETNEVQEFSFDVRFANEERVQTRASVYGLEEVGITQDEDNYVKIDLRHQVQSSAAMQCRVVCRTSGKSAEGLHPCIECTVGGVTVRLCC